MQLLTCKKLCRILEFSLLLLISSSVFSANGDASSSIDAVTMLKNLSNSYPTLIKFITALCYVLGFAFAWRGVFYLKIYGEMRTMMASQSSIKIPIMYLLVAAGLMFIPSTLNTLMYTVFKRSTPISYHDISTTINPDLLKAIAGLVYIIGLIAFIRGWIMLATIAHQGGGGGQHSFGKAMTHIVGGLLAMNILGFTQIIWSAFGFSSF